MKLKRLLLVPFEGNEVTRAARQKIDDDIGELERRMRCLRMKRNELSPIFVLPPEVLSNIFILARNSWTIDTYADEKEWIGVGHVCHHWREIAVSCPSLWSVPLFTHPNLAQEMIQRSKSAALTLTISPTVSTWTSRMLDQLENAFTQTPRIQSIELVLQGHTKKLNTIFSSFSQPALLLEKISLSGSTYGEQCSFPPDAFSDAPRLRRIEFYRLGFTWESAIFRHKNLTDLRLRNSHAAMGTSTMDQLMDVLYHLPNLRILALDDSIPSHTTSRGNEKTLEFKFLEQLELGAKAVDCIFLLRYIQYPSHTTVELDSSSTSVEDSLNVFSLLGQNLYRTQDIEAGIPHPHDIIKSARLDLPERDIVEITLFNTTIDTKTLRSLKPIIRIQLTGGCVVTQAHIRLLTGICNRFNLSSLRVLLLDWTFTDNNICTIRDSLGNLPKLEMIGVARSLLQICPAIAGSLEGKGSKNNQNSSALHSVIPQHSTSPVFPALTTFIVHNVDFRSRYRPQNLERLADMLMKRSNVNAPIDRLSLEFCSGVGAWKKRQLGELVVELEVGGEVIDVRELSSGDGWSDEDEDGGENEDDDEYSDDDEFHSHYEIEGFLF